MALLCLQHSKNRQESVFIPPSGFLVACSKTPELHSCLLHTYVYNTYKPPHNLLPVPIETNLFNSKNTIFLKNIFVKLLPD